MRHLVSRVLAVGVVAVAVTGVTAVAPAPGGSDAAAQTTQTEQQCSTFDLLLLMDQSGSLNGADPGGVQRRAALHDIRRDLSTADEVQVAMIGFNEEPLLHAPRFAPAAWQGQRYPSDSEVEATIPGGGYTDYGVALRTSLEVFSMARNDSCRELVWFTDGLHDVASGITVEEVESAERLRTEVCSTIGPEFAAAGIRTWAVLLGTSFPGRATVTDPLRRRMVQASVNMIGTITGEGVVAGWPVEGCPLPVEARQGSILSGSDARDIGNIIVESIARLRGLLRWRDCENLGETPSQRGGKLPAGAYIDEIQVFSYGGAITRHARRSGSQEQWSPLTEGSRRFTLMNDQLRGLPAGWELLMEVQPDPGNTAADVTLSCYSNPVDTPLEMIAAIDQGQGGGPGVMLPDTPYTLEVDMVPYDCWFDEFTLNHDASRAPVGAEPCPPGASNAHFQFTSGRPDEVEQITQADGRLVPTFAAALWAEQARLPVEVRVDGYLLPDPIVECSQPPGAYPAVETSLAGSDQNTRGRLVAGECVITPPSEGNVTVDAQGSAGGPDYRLETPEGETLQSPLPVNPGDEVQRVRVVSDERPLEELAQSPGDATVTASWQPEGAPSPLAAQEEQLTVLSVGEPPIDLDSRYQPIVIEDSLNPDDPASRVVAGEFTVEPPEGGTVTVEVAESPSGRPYVIETVDGMPLSNPFVLGHSEDPQTIRVISEERPIEGESPGPVVIVVTPPPDEYDIRVPWIYRVPVPPFPPQPVCRSVPRLDGELPYRVVAAECDLVPPAAGTLRFAVGGLPTELAYSIASPEGEALPVPLELGAGDAHQRILIISRELPFDSQARWETEGLVTVTATWTTQGEHALVAQDTFDVPHLLPDPVACEDATLQLSNTPDDEVPSEPLRAVVVCSSPGPGPEGELRLRLEPADSPAVDWLFESGSRVEDGGRTLVIEAGEELREIGLVSGDTLPNDRVEVSGTVTMSAEWALPPLEHPLTDSVELDYELDLWPRSNLWLALLITLLAGLMTWLLFYRVMVRSNRLPPARGFFARRVEFGTFRDPRGKLRSADLANFRPEDSPSSAEEHDMIRVDGDAKRRRLRAGDLQIDAEHASWWQVPSLLRGGWGRPSIRGGGYVYLAKPAGPRQGTTSEHFAELAVVALETAGARETPTGVAYVLVPKRPADRSDSRRDLQQLLADLDGHVGPTSTRRSPREKRG
jgi:hypothetical protein